MLKGFQRYILGTTFAIAAALVVSVIGLSGDTAHAAGEKYFKNESQGPTQTITATGGVYGDKVISFQPVAGRGTNTIYSTSTFMYKVGGENTNVKFPYSDCWWVTISIVGDRIAVGTVAVTIPGVKNDISGIQVSPEDKDLYIKSCNERASSTGTPAYIGMDRNVALTVYSAANPPPDNDKNGDGKVDEAPSENKDDIACSGGLLGWLVCPLTQGLASATTLVAKVLESLLVLKPLSFDTSRSNAIYTVWSLLLNIANIGFVILFLVIIFSQATSMGLSSYGIKSILPKLVAAAILANVSYYVCALAIDLTNIISSGVASLIDVGVRAIPDKDEWSTGAEVGMFAMLTVAITAIMALFLTPLGPALAFALLGVLLAVLTAAITALVIIMGRHLGVEIWVLLSSFAFVSMLSPGTYGFFTGWRKKGTALLVLGIIIPGVFHAAIFVAKFIAVQGIGGDDGTWATPVAVVVILALPLGATPALVKAAGGVGNRLGVFTNNVGKGFKDRVTNKGKEARGLAQGELAAGYDPQATGLGKVTNFGRKVATGSVGFITPRSRSRANFNRSRMANTYEADEMKLATDDMDQRGIMGDKDALMNFITEKKGNKYAKLAAMKQLGEIGAADKLQSLFQGNDSGDRELAAKAISGSSKMREVANNMYFEAATYSGVKRQGGTDSKAAEEGAKVRNKKIMENMSAQYLLNQKPDQLKYIAESLRGMGNTPAGNDARAAFQSSLETLSKSKQAQTGLTQSSYDALYEAADLMGDTSPLTGNMDMSQSEASKKVIADRRAADEEEAYRMNQNRP